MTAEELDGWYAFYQLEPWGCLVEDHRTELGLNLLFNINAKKGSKAPRFIERDPQRLEKPDPTPAELEENIRDFFMGRTIIKAPVEEQPAPPKKSRKTRKDKGVKRPAPTK